MSRLSVFSCMATASIFSVFALGSNGAIGLGVVAGSGFALAGHWFWEKFA
jgi:hypothetical protein